MLIAFAGNISAQVFWSEDFADGQPAGWTNEDVSADYNALWFYCEVPGGAGCLSGSFGQPDFSAPTVDNGFMLVNSDGAATSNHAANPHISQLTTDAIDCSGQSVVYANFITQIGTFELPASTNAILRVSTNLTDWTDFVIFPNMTAANNAWTESNFSAVANITDVAANEPVVYLQWQWSGGWDYFWKIDDVVLTTENPTPPNDIRVNSNFFAGAPNAQTPASQVEIFGFLADVENIGSADQTNVNLTVTVQDVAAPSVNVYEETLGYGTVASDSLVENVLFDAAGYEPPAMPAIYAGQYTITTDSVDSDLSNNVREFDFEVTENVFAKDRGVTRTVAPAESNWDDGESFSWAYGNFYHVVNGTGWWANEVVFGIGNATAALAGQGVFITLYRWEDTNGDGNADPDERTPVGSNTYSITGNEAATEAGLITLPILDNSTLEQGVSLMDDTDYILMLEYNAVDQTLVSFLASGDYNYGAQILRTQELGMARYGSLLGVNDPLSSEPYSSVGFGPDIVPIARMVITDELISSVATLSADNKVNVFPSPASDYIDVALGLTDVQNEVTIRVMDVTGNVIGERQVSNVQNDTYRFNVSALPVGSYFLNVNTQKGNRNVPFVVQR